MPSDLPQKGNLKDVRLPRILTFIQRNGLTGTLTLIRNDQSKSIYCRNGDIIFAASQYADDHLGEFLLKNNKITLRQYEESVEAVTVRGKRQGAFLVEQGYLSPKDLVWAVRQQVQDIVLSLFTWINGVFVFDKDTLPTSEVITLKMSIGDLIYRGIRRINDWVRLMGEIPSSEKVIRITTDPLVLYQRVDLPKPERQFMSLINGHRTLMELFDDSPLDPFDTLKLIYFLIATDMAEVVDPSVARRDAEEAEETPPEARQPEEVAPKTEEPSDARQMILDARQAMDRQDYFELLGIPSNAGPSEIRRAYLEKSKLYHPDRHFSSGLEEIKVPLEELFHRITTAYDTLINEDRKQEYVFRMTESRVLGARRQDPEATSTGNLLIRAKSALAKGNPAAAAHHMELALKLRPDSGEFHSIMALALSKIKTRRKESEFHYKAAIKKDPYRIENFLGLSSLYAGAGLLQRAVRACEEALLWDPGNQKVLRELQRLKKKME